MKKTKVCMPFLMIFALLTFAFAPYGTVSADDIAPWNYVEDTLYIDYFGDMPDFASPLETPWIGFGISGVKKIVIGENTTGIGNNAFSGYTDLESVEFQAGFKTVGEHAFEGCSKLKEIALPDGTESVGTCAFKNCTALETIVLPDSVISIGASAFEMTAVAYYNDGFDLYIGNHLIKSLDYSSADGSYEVKAGTVCIADEAFKDCKKLKKVVIHESYMSFEVPTTLVSVGKSAFENCTALTDINIPYTVTTIGDRAFSNCSSLSLIKLPANVNEIGNETFADCTDLTIRCFQDSYTEEYAKAHGISSKYFSTLPVLNEDVPYNMAYRFNGMVAFGIAPDTDVDTFLSRFLSAVDVYDTVGHKANSGKLCTGYHMSADPGSSKFAGRGYAIAVKGDTDGNGKIDATDYICVKRHILGIAKFEEGFAFYMAADTDGNGKIDATDYISIKRHILGISPLADGSNAESIQPAPPPVNVIYDLNFQ